MSIVSSLSGERSNSKVAAICPTRRDAERVAADVTRVLGADAARITVLSSSTPAPGRRLEPESSGILRTIVIAHSKLALVGLGAGLVFFAILYVIGIPAVTASWPYALVACAGFGGLAGLLLGGLVSLRPDHDPYIHSVRAALAREESAVVVHAVSDAERDHAKAFFEAHGLRCISTL